jgi:hypothetical protein
VALNQLLIHTVFVSQNSNLLLQIYPGVILSTESLDRVVNGAFDNKHKDCKNITYSAADDDVKIGN